MSYDGEHRTGLGVGGVGSGVGLRGAQIKVFIMLKMRTVLHNGAGLLTAAPGHMALN